MACGYTSVNIGNESNKGITSEGFLFSRSDVAYQYEDVNEPSHSSSSAIEAKAYIVPVMEALRNHILYDSPTMILFSIYQTNGDIDGHATVLTGVDATLTYIRVNDPANHGSVKCYLYSTTITYPTSNMMEICNEEY